MPGESGVRRGRAGLRGRSGHQPRQPGHRDGAREVQQVHEAVRQRQELQQDQVRQPLLEIFLGNIFMKYFSRRT